MHSLRHHMESEQPTTSSDCLYHSKKKRNPRYSLHSKLGGPQSHSGKNGEDTNSIAPAGNKKWQPRRQPTILLTDLKTAKFIRNA